MGSAEQGGNHPARTLLVGGPKHGEFINLPQDQAEYEFTSMDTLMPREGPTWEAWPQSATHLYREDEILTNQFMLAAPPKRLQIFTHDTLWNTPAHGGFLLHALREAESALQDSREQIKAWDERLQAKQQIVSDRNKEVSEWQERYEKLLALNDDMDRRLGALRNELEFIAQAAIRASTVTGREFTSIKSKPR